MPFKFSDSGRRSGERSDSRRGERRFEDKSGDEHFRKLFVGGLSYETTKEDLEKHFGEYGHINDSVVMIYPDSKRSRGFGFVTFDSIDVVDAVQEARPHMIDGREVETKRATPRDNARREGPPGNAKKLFIGGLGDDVTEEDVRAGFEFGHITEVEIMKHRDTGKPRGFCFVTFEDSDPVDRVCLHGWVEIAGKKSDVKKAIPKEADRRDRFGDRDGGDRGGRDQGRDRNDRAGARFSSGGGAGGDRSDRGNDGRYGGDRRERNRSRSPVRSYDRYNSGGGRGGDSYGSGGGGFGASMASQSFGQATQQNDALANLSQLAPALASLGTLVGLLSGQQNAQPAANAGGANALNQLVSALSGGGGGGGGVAAAAPSSSFGTSSFDTSNSRPGAYGDRDSSGYGTGYSSSYTSGFTDSYKDSYSR